MSTLREKVVELAHREASLRKHLVPILRKTSDVPFVFAIRKNEVAIVAPGLKFSGYSFTLEPYLKTVSRLEHLAGSLSGTIFLRTGDPVFKEGNSLWFLGKTSSGWKTEDDLRSKGGQKKTAALFNQFDRTYPIKTDGSTARAKISSVGAVFRSGVTGFSSQETQRALKKLEDLRSKVAGVYKKHGIQVDVRNPVAFVDMSSRAFVLHTEIQISPLLEKDLGKVFSLLQALKPLEVDVSDLDASAKNWRANQARHTEWTKRLRTYGVGNATVDPGYDRPSSFGTRVMTYTLYPTQGETIDVEGIIQSKVLFDSGTPVMSSKFTTNPDGSVVLRFSIDTTG